MDSGSFSSSLLSIQLQLRTLLEDVGGEEAAALLDGLTKLSLGERKIAVSLFTSVVQRLSATEAPRLSAVAEQALKEFEENLYRDLLEALANNPQAPVNQESRLAVLNGGRGVSKSPVIDLAHARKLRRERGQQTLT